MLKERFKGVQLKHSVNPDLAIAYGAAIKASIKANRQGMGNKLCVQDIAPFSIGIDCKGQLWIQSFDTVSLKMAWENPFGGTSITAEPAGACCNPWYNRTDARRLLSK